MTKAIGTMQALVAVACVAFGSPVESRAAVFAESAAYAVTLEQYTHQPGQTNIGKVTLRIENKKQKTATQVVLETEFVSNPEHDAVRAIVGAHLLIVGDRLGDAAQIIVMELEPPYAQIVSAKSPSVSVSPTSTKVLYESWRIRASEESQTSVLSLIDLTATRPTAIVVYPVSNARNQKVEAWEERAVDRHVIVSPLSWSTNERTVVFVERLGNGGDFGFVEIDLAGGVNKARVYREAIDTAHLVEPNFNAAARLLIDAVEWRSDSRVVMSLVYEEYFKYLRFALTLPSIKGARAIFSLEKTHTAGVTTNEER